MGKDRFLIGILVGIGVLVIAALVLFFIRQGQVTYGDDSTPAGALQNYFVALQKRDYERAYGYLADQPGKPSLDQFREPFLANQQNGVMGSAVEVDQTTVDPQGQSATVQVTVLTNTRDIFGTANRQTQIATLVRANGAWKVVTVPYPYGYFDMAPKAVPPAPPSSTPMVSPTGTAP